MKNRQFLKNTADVKVSDVNKFNTPIKYLKNKNVKELFMDTKEKDGEKILITIKKSWDGVTSLLTKRKHENEAKACTSNLLAWMVKFHKDGVMIKFDTDVQELLKSAVWKEGVTLCPK